MQGWAQNVNTGRGKDVYCFSQKKERKKKQKRWTKVHALRYQTINSKAETFHSFPSKIVTYKIVFVHGIRDEKNELNIFHLNWNCVIYTFAHYISGCMT